MNEADSQSRVTESDRQVAFSIPHRNGRGRVVRLGPVLDAILHAHVYPDPIKHLLAEALVLTALMGGLLKRPDGQLTMQAQTQGGIIELLVCDYRGGELRGYVKHDGERLQGLGANAPLSALFEKGFLAITFDMQESGERYQGIVPLEGATLAEAVESYFAQSEQLPTLIRTGVQAGPSGCSAGGLLLQHLPHGEEGRERLHVRHDHPEWEHVAILGQSVRHEELVSPALPLEDLIWRLFHEERELLVQPASPMVQGCRCSVKHFEQVLARFSREDRREMEDEQGSIRVDCAFCSRDFVIEI